MNLSRSKTLLLVMLLAFAAAYVVQHFLFKAPTPIEEKAMVFDDSAEKFKSEIASNANKWQDAIVGLKGSVTSVDAKGAMMNETIFCQFKDPAQLQTIVPGQKLKLKARFIGYDDLLEEIKLDQCILSP